MMCQHVARSNLCKFSDFRVVMERPIELIVGSLSINSDIGKSFVGPIVKFRFSKELKISGEVYY